MKQLLFILLTIAFVASTACNNTSDKHIQNADPESASTLPTDFVEFYERFHSDTAFQVAHIVWPLAGQPSPLDGTRAQMDLDNFAWTKDQWVIHKSFNHNAQFERQFEIVNPTLINEESVHRELGLVMLRRFAKTSDGWKLIYYAAP